MANFLTTTLPCPESVLTYKWSNEDVLEQVYCCPKAFTPLGSKQTYYTLISIKGKRLGKRLGHVWRRPDLPSLLRDWKASPPSESRTSAETKNEMESGLLLDVVVGEGAPVFELLASEDQPLLVGRDALLVLDLGLDVVNRVRRLDLERDRLARQRLDEDLHASAEAEHEVEGGFLLDVVVREGAPVFELLAGEYQPLLVGRDALLVLDLGLDVVNRVRRLDLERDRLARKRLHEYLHVVLYLCC